jgi:hypothetical protein
MTNNKFAERLAAALGTVDLMGRALGFRREPSLSWPRSAATA